MKLKLPVMTVSPSTAMTLLWLIACSASMRVGISELARKSAAEYLSVRFDLSGIASTRTPRFLASTRAFAIGADVKLYACTRMLVLASPKAFTILSVQSSPGVKHTVTVWQEASSPLGDGGGAGEGVG